MRPEAFASNERGVARKTVDGYVAFFPEPLPRRIQLPQEVLLLLDEATGAVHRLGGVGRLIPNPHLLIGPHLRIEAVLTAHAAIDALVERGDLHEVTGRERGRIYEAPRIFDAGYGPVDIGEPGPGADPPIATGTPAATCWRAARSAGWNAVPFSTRTRRRPLAVRCASWQYHHDE